MKKRILTMLCVILALLLIGATVYFFFPPTGAFSRLINVNSQDIAKIVITDGNTGEGRTQNDPEKISALFSDLSNKPLRREAIRTDGWAFSIDIYLKDTPGYIRFNPDGGISKFEGYDRYAVTGNYRVSGGTYDEVVLTLKEFYENAEAE